MRDERPSVHVTLPLPPRVMDELAATFRLVDDPAGVDGIVATPRDPVDGAFLDAAGSQLRVVALFAVGFDNVDLDAATERGVLVSNTPDVLTRATAELTLALLLALARRVAEGDRFVRRQEPWSFAPTFMLGAGLEGKTLGVVGLGRIGREVARLGEAFGMRVISSSRSSGIPLEELLADADVVTLHCRLSPETRHLIDADALRRMKPTAVLVNTARGPIVDEEALVVALEAGELAGAALDVFEREPEVHAGLLGRDDVVLTPHVGSATAEAREGMGMLCVEALRAVLLERRVPANALNPEAHA
jgi:lactate dehydrogenase-like 2-hydroxyacid dehydrogenase